MIAGRIGSLAICGNCGRDRDLSAERCVCAALPTMWRLSGATPISEMMASRIGATLLGILALPIGGAIASANSFAVLGTLLLSPLVASVILTRGRQWRTEGGAAASTAFGRLVRAEGRGVALLVLPVASYCSLRGDLVAASGQRANEAWLGSDHGENALLAALLGAASRGSIVLRAEDRLRWSRVGRARKLEERAMSPEAVLIERTEAFAAEEDKLLHDLLAAASARGAGGTGYRDGQATEGRTDDPVRPALGELLVGLGDASVLVERYRETETSEATRARLFDEMARAADDPSIRSTLRALLHDIRRGAQTRVARVLARGR